jgi:16S rRNA (cytosine967-C5)-methyltransferase
MLVDRQLKMLKKLWPLLKPGGQLLYATCSLLVEENAGVVSRFLAQQTDARENRIVPVRDINCFRGQRKPTAFIML